MSFFSKERGGPKIGCSKQQAGKKTNEGYGRQYHILGNDGTNGKIPITKKAKNIID